MKTSTLKRTGNLIATIFFLFLTLGMMHGSVQNVIEFAGIPNEIGFTVMSLSATIIFACLTVIE
jgi:hypothetical protein